MGTHGPGGHCEDRLNDCRVEGEDVLGKPVVIVPIVNHDNNQHAANENLRLRNLWDGIAVFSALFTGLGPAWE